MQPPVRITITGAAGSIGYAIAFRIAAGDMLGKEQPVILQFLEVTPALDRLKGIVMELNDCAFPLLKDIIATDNPAIAFKDCNYALLVGARPRAAGMERKDLLAANGAIFAQQGKALNEYASRDVKVVVVGNPANTNALIAQRAAPNLHPTQFTAMTRLDHNRALTQLAKKIGVHTADIKNMIIWGNHSSTQYPDLSHAKIGHEFAKDLLDNTWIKEKFIPTVQQRGGEIIKYRGASSAASAASAIIDHMRDWTLGTAKGDWVSMGIPSDGSYGIEPGIIYSYPVTCKNGQYEIVQNLTIDEDGYHRMRLSEKELREEHAEVAHYFL